ncbi:MAG: sugar phosphate isomerase/epimerase family protein [Clostridia bacterium]
MMKLSFSTLACPEWSLSEICKAAVDHGYDGIEIRGIGRHTFLPDIEEFSDENCRNTMKEIRGKGLDIPVFSSDCVLCVKDGTDEILSNAIRYVEAASLCGVPFVRVLCDHQPTPSDVDFAFTADNLMDLAAFSADMDVCLLVETNGYFASSRNMKRLLRRVGDLPVMVLWDMNHTCRYFQESPEETYDRIGEYIAHVHVKDSVMAEGGMSYRLPGEGDIPLEKAVKVLEANGYQGYYSLEWLRRWDSSLEESGVVLPHYVHYMKNLL